MIRRMLDISTAHVTEETMKRCNAKDKWIVAYETTYGAFVWVPDDLSAPGNLEGYPEDLVIVLKFAHRLNCAWVQFDCDFVKFNNLPTYVWTSDTNHMISRLQEIVEDLR